MRIHILRCGTIHPPKGKSALSGRAALPVWCFLAEHPVHGPLLIDTGLGRGALSGWAGWYYRPEPGETAAEQLARMGLLPEELGLVLLTDLDADRTGGLRELRRARRILVSEEAYYWACRWAFARRQPKELWEDADLETFYFRGAPGVPAGHALDLFGDGSVELVLTPGHSFGATTVILREGGRFAVLAGNALRRAASPESGYVYHPWQQERTLSYLRSLAADPACAAVLAGCDPEERPRVLTL